MAAAHDAKNPCRRIGTSKKWAAARGFAGITNDPTNPLMSWHNRADVSSISRRALFVPDMNPPL
jgi:hypothetical protein